jgi:hypothetical protein
MIDFEIELHGDMMHHFHIHGHGLIRFPSKELIFDPSVIHYLMNCTVKKNEYVVYIPDTLLKLITLSKENDEYKRFLIKFLTYFSYSRTSTFSENNYGMFYSNMEKLKTKPITLENIDDKEKYEKIVSMFERHKFYISMSPKINFLGDILGKIIGFSKTRGIAILSKTRRLSNLLREKIIALELPERFDKAVMGKQEVVGELFDFQGGKATKFFIGIALSFGGFIHPAIGVPGLMFAFMDP